MGAVTSEVEEDLAAMRAQAAELERALAAVKTRIESLAGAAPADQPPPK
jgi:hypothetical protein